VVDANKNVYVYDNHGVLQGSWSAGGLSSSAALTGIATNGTDIWLVDSYSDKVYKYAGAASRLSGSQSAASSFRLNRSDPNPQDIVTDGTSFWVVDGTAIKVFKYTLSGSLLGSWAIDPANTHPTGITINPNNVSDIWIVDSSTLKVYQYAGAASRTSGSQNAAATFALNPYDTDPQGIADPPPADMLLTSETPPAALSSPAVAVLNAASSVAGVPSLAGGAAFSLLGREPLPTAGEPAVGLPAGGALTPHTAVAVLNAASVVGPSAVAGVPTLASRDAVFALLAQGASYPYVALLAGTALAPHLDSPTPAADRAWAPTGAAGGQKPLDPLPALPSEGSHGIRSDRSAVALPDDTLAGDSPASAPETDSVSAGLAEEAPAEE
jgi:hypothetical protein